MQICVHNEIEDDEDSSHVVWHESEYCRHGVLQMEDNFVQIMHIWRSLIS